MRTVFYKVEVQDAIGLFNGNDNIVAFIQTAIKQLQYCKVSVLIGLSIRQDVIEEIVVLQTVGDFSC